MACSLKQTCVIEDAAAVQKYLFEEEGDNEDFKMEGDDGESWKEWANDWGDTGDKKEDEPQSDTEATTESENNWVHKCKLAFSPTYDLLAVSYGDKLVLLSVRSDTAHRHRADGPRRYKISQELTLSDEPGEYITSVICVPLVSLKKTSHGSVDWSCVIVGFSSGYVRMYTETGDQLISQLLHESPVIEIGCRTHDPMVMRRSVTITDQPDEVTILYGDALILLEGFSLFQTLRACRSQVALAAASGGSAIEPPPLSYKKWRLTGGQGVISSHVSPGVLTANPFDHMRTASILGGFQAEIRGTAPAMSCFVATGSSPFTGFYYAVEGSAQPHLSHVALAVASKLKSALYSSASRWLAWGTGAPQETEQKPKPKVELGSPLDIRCGMPDPLRHGGKVVLAPGAHLSTTALAATTDSLGRVILMDVARAIALRMWKGYRDAQVGFIRVFDDAHRGHKHGEQKSIHRHALFLIIYAPRRGLLEVWTCVNGPRVGAFNVSKNARLLCPGYGMMGINTATMSITTSHAFQCCLLEANGQVKEIKIPFHLALSDANSKKARDMHLLKKLNLILHSRRKTSEEAVKILLEIRISGMLRQALEKMLHTRKIGAETFRSCINAIQQRLKEGGALKKADNDLLKYCEAQICLIDLYEALQKLNDVDLTNNVAKGNKIEDVQNIDMMSKLLHMTKTEATEALTAVARYQATRHVPRVKFDDPKERPTMDIAEFLDCFCINDGMKGNNDGLASWEPELRTMDEQKSLKLAAFIFHSSLFGSSTSEDVLFALNGSLNLNPRVILNLIFQHWLAQDSIILNDMANSLAKLFTYVESCSKKNASMTTSVQSGLSGEAGTVDSTEPANQWEWIRENICATSVNTISAYFLAIVSRGVAISSNTKESKTEKDSEDVDDWEKMQTDEQEEDPPSYQESCDNGSRQQARSGDWETLWLDVEKWNLFVHQLEDSILINTAINLGHARPRSPHEKSETHQRENDKPISSSDTASGPTQNVSVKDLLSNGPGYMAELVSHSICVLNVPSQYIEKHHGEYATSVNESQNLFLDFLHQVLYNKFPYSLAPDCLHSHCFWELMLEWNKDPLEMTKFSNAIEHLRLVSGDAQARHGLALMAWKTFIFKRYAILAKLMDKVGKAPKDRLCRKEVGISDSAMPSFCQSCTDILQIIADAEPDMASPATDVDSGTLVGGAEDPWQNVTGKRSIMDMGRAHPQAHIGLVQHNMHLSFILHATMQFLLRGVKPLSGMFNQRGKACFALDLTAKDPLLPNPENVEPELNKIRRHFLTKVVSAAVQHLAAITPNVDVSESQTLNLTKEELEKWIETTIHMAAEFQLSVEKIKMHYVDELFKNGLDAVGLEACATVIDKEVLASSLVLVVGQRLSYILLHANPDDGVIMMSRMSPTLSTWIRSQDSSMLKQPNVPVSDTLTLARTALTMMSEGNSLYSMALALEEAASSMTSGT